jgi:hypothetical protein
MCVLRIGKDKVGSGRGLIWTLTKNTRSLSQDSRGLAESRSKHLLNTGSDRYRCVNPLGPAFKYTSDPPCKETYRYVAGGRETIDSVSNTPVYKEYGLVPL